MMYEAYEAHADLMWPLRSVAKVAAPMMQDPRYGVAGRPASRQVVAACKLIELAEVTHRRPPWRIDAVLVGDESVPVSEEIVVTTPFATLLRFRKTGAAPQPKVLVVAPMSG